MAIFVNHDASLKKLNRIEQLSLKEDIEVADRGVISINTDQLGNAH